MSSSPKLDWFSPVTKWPFLSVTVKTRSTSLTCTLMVETSASGTGFCAAGAGGCEVGGAGALAGAAGACANTIGAADARAKSAKQRKRDVTCGTLLRKILDNSITLTILPNRRALCAQPAKKLSEFGRQRSLDRQRLASLRMRELEMRGMEKIPVQPH